MAHVLHRFGERPLDGAYSCARWWGYEGCGGLRNPLTVLFARLAETRSTLEELLAYEEGDGEEILARLRLCRAAIDECLVWRGANDRERSARTAIDNTLRSCLDGVHMAELGIMRNRRDMVESASTTLAAAHERMLAISRVLQE
jgi:hypothetical protein